MTRKDRPAARLQTAAANQAVDAKDENETSDFGSDVAPVATDEETSVVVGIGASDDGHSALEQSLRSVFEIVKTRTGHDFSSYKRNTVLRRIERRIAVNEAGGMAQYVSLLLENPSESQALCQDILIGVTGFFRDPEAFAALEREVVPRLFANRSPDEPVRIWHACCATGEEVYSMAILVQEYLDAEKLDARVQFFATDIDEAAIRQARSGLYPDQVGAEIGEERLRRFFTRVNDGWQVARHLREMIVFAPHSLIKDPPFSRLDLLVCRNFLIYLNSDMQRRLIPLFHQVLRPGGVLFLGAAETVGLPDLFSPVDKKWKIFKRLESQRRADVLLPFSAPLRRPLEMVRPARQTETVHPSPDAAAEKLLLERYAPPSLVVNEKYEVVHVSIKASPFLEVPVGEPTRDILKMAREDLRPPLRAAIYKAFAEEKQIQFRGVQVDVEEGTATVNVLVEPLCSSASGKLVLVVLEPVPQRHHPAPMEGEVAAAGGEDSKALLIRQLEEQLRLTHEQLHATIEQLESSHEGFLSANEELMSINEEYQAANEELQSTNEELETSKEELQALNEELITVNTELQGTVEELNLAHSDLENLLTSSEIATLFLDRKLHIKGYTPAMAAIFNLIPADVGRPFRHLAGTIDWSGLAHDSETVLERLLPIEREVTAVEDGRHYLMRVLPYRTAHRKIDGIVVTLVDLTERKRMEDELLHAKEEWERTFDSVPDLIAILDDQNRMVRANRALKERMGGMAEAQMGEPCYRSVHGTDHPPQYCPHVQTLRDGREHVAEIREERLGGDFLITTTPLVDERGRMTGAVHVARDITDLKRAEEALRQSKQQVEQHLAQLQAILDHLSDGVVTSDLEGNLFHWNTAALAMHGFESMEECRRRLSELTDIFELSTEEEGILPLEQWPLARILRGETLRDWEVQVRRRETGWQRVFSYGGTLARGQEGQPLLAVVSITDVTDRKRTEAAHAQLAAIVESSEDAVVSKDLHGVIRSWNDGAQRMFGFLPEEAIGKPIALVIPAELQEEEERIMRQVAAGERVHHFETVRIAKDGRGIDVSVTVSPIRDRRGRIIGASKIVRDITDQKRAREAVRQSELQFRTLADAIPQLCWMANADGWIFWYNQRWYEYTGTTAEQMEGWGWQSVHDPAVLPSVMERWRGSIATGEPFDMVFPLRGADGAFRPFLTRVLPVRDREGKVARWFGTNTDIAEQREREQALRYSNARLDVLADTTSALLKADSPQETVNALCQKVMAFLDCQAFFNFLVDEEEGRLHLNACAGIPEQEVQKLEWLDYGAAVCGCAARDACRIVAEDIPDTPDPRTELVKSYGITAYACHPLMAQGRVLGTLSFGTSTRSRFTEEELSVMKSVADQVAIAMERKRMEESVRQSEAMLEAFFDASPGILNILDENFRYIKTDRLTPTYFGLDRHSIVGKSKVELVPGFITNYGAMMRRVIETGEPELNLEVQTPLPSRSGQVAHWLASYFPVPLSKGKRGIGIMGVEITGKKKAEEALRRAHDELEQRVKTRTEELASTVEALLGEIAQREQAEASLSRLNRFYAVLSEIDQAIVRAADRDSIFRDFCRIAVEHGGFLLAWVGLVDEADNGVRMVAASGATAYLDQIGITANEEPEGEGPTGISIRNGNYHICNDFQNDPCTKAWHERGKLYGIGASASIALKEEDRVIGALTLYAGEKDSFDPQHVALLRQMGTDISFALENLLREARRRQAEQALQEETLERLQTAEALRDKERLLIQQSRQAALGEMIGNIAHQWRQPLNTLGLMVQELSLCYDTGSFSSDYLESTVNKVMQVIYHMSQTIDDFRYFFRPEKEKVDFRVLKIIEKVISIIDGSLKEQAIRIEVSAHGDPVVHGYPNEYSQVLLNILLNARDAFAEREVGDPHIEVKLFEEDERIVVTVDDNAGGIPADIIDKIFDPYFTTKGPNKGTGVGLYMSKVIIEKNMNGRLTARNTEHGVTFRIEF